MNTKCMHFLCKVIKNKIWYNTMQKKYINIEIIKYNPIINESYLKWKLLHITFVGKS